MVQFKDITDALANYPDLYSTVPYPQIDRFIRFGQRLKREIQSVLPPTADLNQPPHRLPQYVHEFFRNALAFTDLETMQCWSALKDVVWSENGEHAEELNADDTLLFQLHGASPVMHKQERLGEYLPVARACILLTETHSG